MEFKNVKVESGIQLLARLSKKSGIESFYPTIFKNGPKHGDIIELYSEGSANCILAELICESLMPIDLNGPESGVLIYNTDGNLNPNYLFKLLKYKITKRLTKIENSENMSIEHLLQSLLENLYILDIFDVTQFYISIQNLEVLLTKYPNISLVVFNTLSAFYWCEQDIKITKMDLYVKKLLCTIQKVLKDYKVTLLYTRPEYFSSNKVTIDQLEPCYEHPMGELLNYRIQIVYNNDINYINIRTFNETFQRQFQLIDDEIIWV